MRELLKQLARCAATVVVAPVLASYALQARLLGRDQALELHGQGLSLLPGLSGRYLRNAFYRRTLAACDATAVVEFGVLISKTQARIGPRTYIGPRCHLGWAILEEGALLGPAVHVTSGSQTHGIAGADELIGDQPGRLRPVTVGRGAWIGAAAVVMNDVGAGTAVGAGTVVTRALPAGVVAVGVPARVIHRRDGAVQSRAESEGEELALPATGGT